MQRFAVLICQHLYFNVTRLYDKFFEINHRIAKGGLGLSPGSSIGLCETCVVVNSSHAPAAATCGSFYNYRKADFFSEFKSFSFVGNFPFGTRHDRNIGLLGQFTCFNFIPKQLHRLYRRADEFYTAFPAYFGKVNILCQKTIARMYGVNVGNFCCAHNSRNIQIAQRGTGRADTNSLVGKSQIWAVRVSFGIHCDSLDAHLVAGADDTQCNFAAISYEYS